MTTKFVKYFALQKKYPTAVILLKLGDFYEVLGEQARAIANALDLTLTSRGLGDGWYGERVPMCGLPHKMAHDRLEEIKKIGQVFVMYTDTQGVGKWEDANTQLVLDSLI